MTNKKVQKIIDRMSDNNPRLKRKLTITEVFSCQQTWEIEVDMPDGQLPLPKERGL